MMKAPEIVYCVFLPTGRVRTVIDAIRLIAKPAVRHSAHITVRGPYAEYHDPRPWSEAVRGKSVQVVGVDRFLSSEQNTVYLGVESDALQALAFKPDYPSPRLHLTIYNGPNLTLAAGLSEVFKRAEPHYSFRMTGLEPLSLRRGFGELRYSYDPVLIAEVLDTPPTIEEIDAADDSQRVAWVDQLASALSTACPA